MQGSHNKLHLYITCIRGYVVMKTRTFNWNVYIPSSNQQNIVNYHYAFASIYGQPFNYILNLVDLLSFINTMYTNLGSYHEQMDECH